MVSLVLEEVTLKSWRVLIVINFENTAGEYKRWSEISLEERATARATAMAQI